MADKAVASGHRIGVAATLATTLEPSKRLLRLRAEKAGKDVVIAETNASLAVAGTKIDEDLIKNISAAGISKIRILKDVPKESTVIKMLEKDTTNSQEMALKEIYRKLRPGDPPTVANARALIKRLFFDERRYNLGRIGRYKLNQKLDKGTSQEDLETTTLKTEDIERVGITGITPEDIKHAQSNGERIKLIAEAYKENDEVKAKVTPMRLKLSHPLANVNDAMNALTVATDGLEEVTVIGRGACGLGAAHGLLTDIISIHRL